MLEYFPRNQFVLFYKRERLVRHVSQGRKILNCPYKNYKIKFFPSTFIDCKWFFRIYF